MRRRVNGWLAWVVVALAFGCGGEEAPGPNAAVAPFVGTWDGTEFTVTSAANPSQVADLLENGSFFLVVEPSGLYNATLVFGQLPPITDIGQITVSGSFITLTPNGDNPCPASSEYVFSGPDYVTLDGPTCFDFNLDGIREDAEAHLELQRR